jgi:octaprenyl-diphosphate synthase
MIPNRTEALADLYRPIAGHLDQVSRLFDEELESELPFVRDLCKHVSRYRGKMLRPALVLLSGEASGGVTREHITLGAVSEMVHIATLVHDDVLDEGCVRRGLPTINALQGNEAAVLLGDYLISHAFHLCSSLDSQYASRLIGSTTNTVCEGELLQVQHRGNFKLTEQEYREIIFRKTASLTSTCCILGAKYADADAKIIAAFEGFGWDLGIAFQIIDDVLDISGNVEEMGKTLGRDLDEDKLTLPLIHLINQGALPDREEALHILSNGYGDRAERIRKLVIRNESLTYAIESARKHVRSAVHRLADLPESDSKSSLIGMAEFVLQRRI